MKNPSKPVTKPLAKKVTIQDIARRVGINASSVSRALNPETKDRLTPELVAEVERAAKTLGYVPNKMAHALRSGRSNTIGVLVPDIMNPIFPPIVRGVQDELRKNGYMAMITYTDNDRALAREEVQNLKAQLVDGFINVAAFLNDDLLEDDKVPTVFLYRKPSKAGINAVLNDDPYGIRLAVEHLLSLGHTTIGHVSGPLTISAGIERYRAFSEMVQAHGLASDKNLVIVAEKFDEDAGAAAFRKLYKARPDLTAVIAGNDLMAIGCLQVVQELGKRCPEDISIIGFNNMPYLQWFATPLTTVAIRHYDMGVQAAKLLVQRITQPDSRPQLITITPELIIRRSTARPPKAKTKGKKK